MITKFKRYHKPFRLVTVNFTQGTKQEKMKTVRFMLLEKLTQDKDEPDFQPKYKKITPPGLGQRQATSLGVGQSLTAQPVYRDENEIMASDPASLIVNEKREHSADTVTLHRVS